MKTGIPRNARRARRIPGCGDYFISEASTPSAAPAESVTNAHV